MLNLRPRGCKPNDELLSLITLLLANLLCRLKMFRFKQLLEVPSSTGTVLGMHYTELPLPVGKGPRLPSTGSLNQEICLQVTRLCLRHVLSSAEYLDYLGEFMHIHIWLPKDGSEDCVLSQVDVPNSSRSLTCAWLASKVSELCAQNGIESKVIVLKLKEDVYQFYRPMYMIVFFRAAFTVHGNCIKKTVTITLILLMTCMISTTFIIN